MNDRVRAHGRDDENAGHTGNASGMSGLSGPVLAARAAAGTAAMSMSREKR